MLEEIAIQYATQSEDIVRLIGYGILIVGAIIAASFHKSTSIGCDCWPLREYAKVDKGDLDRFGGCAAA